MNYLKVEDLTLCGINPGSLLPPAYFEKITDLLDEAVSRLRTDEFDKLLEYIEDELEDYKE